MGLKDTVSTAGGLVVTYFGVRYMRHVQRAKLLGITPKQLADELKAAAEEGPEALEAKKDEISEQVDEILEAAKAEAEYDQGFGSEEDLSAALTPCAKALKAYVDGEITEAQYNQARELLGCL